MEESKSPFKFGKVVTGQRFSNRRKERKRLELNFRSGINTMLISPRRWGKSSLVRQVAAGFGKRSKTQFCFIDLMGVRTEEEFYDLFARSLIESTSNKMEDLMRNAKEFLGSITPRFSFSTDPDNSIEIGFDLEQLKMNYSDVLDLPEKIAIKKKIDLIVCIDEFQNLANIRHSEALQGKLRASWQHHQNAHYCLYGSKRHLLLQIFNSTSMPFYKFGDVIFLEKIPAKDLVAFIVKRFEFTGKKIGVEVAEGIVEAMQCHPYYVQQLAHLVWVNTRTTAKMPALEQAVSDLLEQNDIFYQREFENLSNAQMEFVKALVKGETKFSSQEVLRKFDLGSSSNVVQIKNALEKKEIIDLFQGDITLLDPGFELWFKERICK